MKGRSFAVWEGRNQAKLPQVEGYHRGMHRRAMVWLLASALPVFGTADALSAARHKDASSAPRHKDASSAASHKDTSSAAHHKEASSATHHKSASSHRKKPADEVVHRKRVIGQPDGEAAAAPLTPELAAVKQANELVRQGKGKAATARAASIRDPVAA